MASLALKRLSTRGYQQFIVRIGAVQRPTRLCSPHNTLSLFLQCRGITNATKLDHVESLQTVREAPAKPGGWKPTLIHSSGEVKFTVIRVPPGCEVPSHFHHDSWDYFVPLEGQGMIETKGQDGEEKSFAMQKQSFLAVPPKDVHRVSNASADTDFVFLIAQSPRNKYDFVEAN